MADNEIKIIVSAVDKASGNINKISGAFQNFKTDASNLIKQIPGVGSALNLLSNPISGAIAGIGALVKVGSDAIKFTEQWGLTVDDTARKLGTTTEEASKLLILADDMRVDMGSLNTAFRVALKDGIVPSIEGLQSLSAEYVKINDPAQRAQFAMDKFGRAGLEMMKILEQGPDKLKEMGDALEYDARVMDRDAVDAAKNYWAQMDNLTDSAEQLKVKLGNALLPAVISVTSGLNNLINAQTTWSGTMDDLNKAVDYGIISQQEYYTIQGKLKYNAIELSDAQAILDEKTKAYNASLETSNDVGTRMASTVAKITANEEEATETTTKFISTAIENYQRGKMPVLEYKEAVDNVAISIFHAQQAEFAAAAMDALNQAFKDKKLSADQYRGQLIQVMKWTGDYTQAEIVATLKMADLSTAFRQGEIDAVGFSNAAMDLYNNLNALEREFIARVIVEGAGGEAVQQLVEQRGAYTGGGGAVATTVKPSTIPTGPPAGVRHAEGTGGWMTVPSGYPDDSFMVGLTSGERYYVQNAQTAAEQEKEIEKQRNNRMGMLDVSMSGMFGNSIMRYKENLGGTKSSMVEIAREMDRLKSKEWLGPKQQKALEGLEEQYQSMKETVVETAQEQDKAFKKMSFDLLKQRAAVDGISEAEEQLLTNVAQSWGLIDPATLSALTSIESALSGLASGLDVNTVQQSLFSNLSGLSNGTTNWNLTINEAGGVVNPVGAFAMMRAMAG